MNNYNFSGLPPEIEAALYGLEFKPLDAGNLIDLPKPDSSNLTTGDDYILYGQLLKEYAEQEERQNEKLHEWRNEVLSLVLDTKKKVFHLSHTSDFQNNEVVFDSILEKTLEYSTSIKDMSFGQAITKHSCDKFKKSFRSATELYLGLVELFNCRTETKFEGLLKTASTCFLPHMLLKDSLAKKKKLTVKNQAVFDQLEILSQSMTEIATVLADTIEKLDYSIMDQNFNNDVDKGKVCKALFPIMLADFLLSIESSKKM